MSATYEERAPQPSRQPRRGFEIGSVLSRGFSIWGRNLIPFLLLTALLQIPTYAWNWTQTGSVLVAPNFREQFMEQQRVDDATTDSGARLSDQRSPWDLMMRALVGGLISLVTTQLLTATLVYGVFGELRNRRASIGECLSQGFARLFPALGVAMLTGLVLIALALPFGALMVMIPLFSIVLLPVLLVFLALVYCGLFVAVPAAVVERPGVFAALSRSWNLTRGNRARIFGLLFLLYILMFLAGAVVGFATGALGNLDRLSWIASLFSLFTFSLFAVITAVTYHDLRVAKDGIDSEELASIFD